MATSPNFSWPEPDNSDLVKNGALAIRTAVDAIDSSMADLKGGTTGQVLTKATDTDMDFTWSSGASVPTSYGFTAGKNKIINGDFTINQRNFTSSTTSTAYGFDRFMMIYVDGTVTYSAQTFTVGTAPVAGYEGKNFARIVTSGQTATGARANWKQPIENVRTLAGQTATISFWAKAGSGTPKIAVELWQGFGSGGSPSTGVPTYAGQVTLSTSWARYSVTVAVPSISGKTIGTTENSSELQCNLFVSAGSDLNSRTGSLGIQSNTFDVWGVQVEAGSTATDFQTATGTIQGELAACQRYYWRNSPGVAYAFFSTGNPSNSTTDVRVVIQNPIRMRATPTSVDYSSNLGLQDGSTIYSVSAVSLNTDGTNNFTSVINATSSGLTAQRAYVLLSNNSTSTYIGINAEL
jgi:hypothetical protein